VKIAIKNPAPLGKNLTKWGDYHFGLALQRALEAEGASVVMHFWPEWHRDEGEDVVLVLRGKQRYEPTRGKVHLLWIMSHPSTVIVDEIDSYDLAYVSSTTHRELLQGATRTPVRVLRQCTDTSRFTAPTDDAEGLRRRDVVFVANSRGVRRDVLVWAIEAGSPPAIVGRHWGGVGLGHLVKREYVDNDELPEFYRAARLSLNDHWSDMRHYGIINNRIFDCLACGLPVLTDAFPELREVCGDSVLYASDPASYREAMTRYVLRYPDLLERTGRLWERLRREYSFETRAQQIVSEASSLAPKASAKRSVEASRVQEPFRTLTSELLTAARAEHGVRELHFLHVLPTPSGVAHLHAQAGVNYLSASLGPGPWHIALSTDVTQVPEDRFDVIVVEAVESLERLGAAERGSFLRALVLRLRGTGMLGVATGAAKGYWRELVGSLGLAVVAEGGRWMIVTRERSAQCPS
jgi:hypothetical protein